MTTNMHIFYDHRCARILWPQFCPYFMTAGMPIFYDHRFCPYLMATGMLIIYDQWLCPYCMTTFMHILFDHMYGLILWPLVYFIYTSMPIFYDHRSRSKKADWAANSSLGCKKLTHPPPPPLWAFPILTPKWAKSTSNRAWRPIPHTHPYSNNSSPLWVRMCPTHP